MKKNIRSEKSKPLEKEVEVNFLKKELEDLINREKARRTIVGKLLTQSAHPKNNSDANKNKSLNQIKS